MKYKCKLKSLEEIIKSFTNKDVPLTFLNYVIENQDKVLNCRELSKERNLFIVEERFCFLKENFSELKEIKENEVWKPEIGERFFSIGCDVDIFASEMKNYDLSIDLIKNYNAFKTFEQAEQVKKVIKLVMAQMAWKFQNDDVELNFKKNCIKKFYIIYNHKENKFKTDYNWEYESLNLIYFSSEEKAKQCLEFLKKDGLL